MLQDILRHTRMAQVYWTSDWSISNLQQPEMSSHVTVRGKPVGRAPESDRAAGVQN